MPPFLFHQSRQASNLCLSLRIYLRYTTSSDRIPWKNTPDVESPTLPFPFYNATAVYIYLPLHMSALAAGTYGQRVPLLPKGSTEEVRQSWQISTKR